jgi:murein DD-endopeptidase MepM/ murein hydrolase activator NlpD
MILLKYPLPIRDGIYETTRFGDPAWWFSCKYHPGTDLICAKGTPVYGPYKGQLVFARDERDGYGLKAIIHHYSLGSVWTLYGHLSEITARVGSEIAQGQIFARTGRSGFGLSLRGGIWVKMPVDHLHYELRVWKNDIPHAVDPEKFCENWPWKSRT